MDETTFHAAIAATLFLTALSVLCIVALHASSSRRIRRGHF